MQRLILTMFLCLTAIFCFLATSTAVAQIAWTGSPTTDWNDGNSWSGGIVPSPGDDVVLGDPSLITDIAFISADADANDVVVGLSVNNVTVNHSAGIASFNNLTLGDTTAFTIKSTWNQSGTSSVDVIGDVVVGGNDGVYSMDGGSLTIAGAFQLGPEQTGGGGATQADLNLSNGASVTVTGPIILGGMGDGTIDQGFTIPGFTSVEAQYVELGGDLANNPAGTTTHGGSYVLIQGSLTTNDPVVGIRVGTGVDGGSGSEMTVFASVITSAGGLSLGGEGDGTFHQISESGVTGFGGLSFGGDLTMNSIDVTKRGIVQFTSSPLGIETINFGGDLDVSDGSLRLDFADLGGLSALTGGAANALGGNPDLKLFDTTGSNPVTGELSYDSNFSGGFLQQLEHGDLLVDLVGGLGGKTYYISYHGDSSEGGVGNDVWITAAPVESADFDNDGDVDGNDLLIWQRGFGSGTLFSEGDANGDDLVNDLDLLVWESQFGNVTPAVAAGGVGAPVPEPSSLLLMGLATCLLTSSTYRRRRG